MVRRGNELFAPVGQLRDEFDRHFNRLFNFPSLSAGLSNGRGFPALNVWESGDVFYAEAEVPGLTNDDLEISVVGSELTLKGQRKDSAEEGATFHRRERGIGAFSRVVRLPAEVDSSKVQANLRDGVLLITLPKHEAAKPRKIQVNTKGRSE
jgi:HSP20 family protein